MARARKKRKTALEPSGMNRTEFVTRFGGVFEHSPWIAGRAFDAGLGPEEDTASGLHAAMTAAFRASDAQKRLRVLTSHPDLAGRLAEARRLTPESAAEQADAGLDALTDEERAAFTELNERYVKTFGFPFIIAVRGRDKDEILTTFRERIDNDGAAEFEEACQQVEQIALLRLRDMLPD